MKIRNMKRLQLFDQVAAQVEIYPTKISAATTEHMDSSHSASPTTTWNSRKQTITSNNMREIDPARGRSEGNSFQMHFSSIQTLMFSRRHLFFAMNKIFLNPYYIYDFVWVQIMVSSFVLTQYDLLQSNYFWFSSVPYVAWNCLLQIYVFVLQLLIWIKLWWFVFMSFLLFKLKWK